MTMTTSDPTSGTTTGDFQSTKTFTAAPDAVFEALTSIDALTGWWNPAAGGALAGDTLRFFMGTDEVVMRVVEADRPAHVRWSVLLCEPARDWEGTSITFDIAPAAGGSELQFRHHGLNPALECYDQCYAGWTHYLASLVDFVDKGEGHPNRHDNSDAERVAAWRTAHTAR